MDRACRRALHPGDAVWAAPAAAAPALAQAGTARPGFDARHLGPAAHARLQRAHGTDRYSLALWRLPVRRHPAQTAGAHGATGGKAGDGLSAALAAAVLRLQRAAHGARAARQRARLADGARAHRPGDVRRICGERAGSASDRDGLARGQRRRYSDEYPRPRGAGRAESGAGPPCCAGSIPIVRCSWAATSRSQAAAAPNNLRSDCAARDSPFAEAVVLFGANPARGIQPLVHTAPLECPSPSWAIRF